MLKTGSCLRGGVKYTVTGPMRDVHACHCSQCRKTSGNFVAATRVAKADLTFERQATLTWYRSSGVAERGFCNTCGGNLFWRRLESETISIMAGTIDPPTGLKITQHIFVAEKSDFYELFDDIEKLEQW
eukprot:gene13034-13134_t